MTKDIYRQHYRHILLVKIISIKNCTFDGQRPAKYQFLSKQKISIPKNAPPEFCNIDCILVEFLSLESIK
jgi:hypothetical protein